MILFTTYVYVRGSEEVSYWENNGLRPIKIQTCDDMDTYWRDHVSIATTIYSHQWNSEHYNMN